MKIKRLTLKNFRGYKGETTIDFGDLTTFIGRNDVGKSTIVEALDLFFNFASAKYKEEEDANVFARKDKEGADVEIGVCFTDIPEKVVIDSSYPTSLSEEYLLNQDGDLEIIRKGDDLKKLVVRAYHPTNEECSDLLMKKITALRKIVKDKNIECADKTASSELRKSIWRYYSDSLNLQMSDIEISKILIDDKKLEDALWKYLPTYALFKADRENNDKDSEIQNPLTTVLKGVLKNDKEVQKALAIVERHVNEKMTKACAATYEKLKEIDPKVAKSLKPSWNKDCTWEKAFQKVDIKGDSDIPINKRGSGVRRLVLLSFFQAQVDLMQSEKEAGTDSGVVYAIEEPETSQHVEKRRMLINALKDLSKKSGVQIILTTHSPTIVKEMNKKQLRLIEDINGHGKQVRCVDDMALVYNSLNEVNYLAFGDISEEYHNELYGFIDEIEKIEALKERCKKRMGERRNYRDSRNPEKNREVSICEYIRHLIHHPENKYNEMYSREDLLKSIKIMRKFIIELRNCSEINASTSE